jgi:hypothetical protein
VGDVILKLPSTHSPPPQQREFAFKKEGLKLMLVNMNSVHHQSRAASKRQRASVHFKLCFLREMLGTHSLVSRAR